MVYDYYILSPLLCVPRGAVKLGRGQCGDSSFIVTVNNTGNEILIFPLCFAHSARYLQVSGLFGCFFSSALAGRG